MTTLTLKRGDDDSFDLAIKDKTGAAYPLESAYLTFTVKQFYSDDDEDALMVKTIENGGIVVTEAGSGYATLVFVPEDTPSEYFSRTRRGLLWDLQVQKGGESKTLDSGFLNVEADVTR